MTVSRSLAWVPPHVPAAGRLFLALAGRLRHGSLHLVTPDGDVQIGDAASPLAADLRITDWRACGRILRSGDVGFAEAYRDGWIDSGNLTNLLRLAIVNAATLDQAIFGNALARSVLRLRHLLRRNSRRGSRRNIHLHYDLGNDFYRLWLDEGMAYSSAWFNGNLRHGLAEAQAAKFRRVCDLLRVEPGMDVLEIGCGWGGLMEMACARGAHVHGITLSEEQRRYTAERLAGEPRARVELRDYRDLDGAYDAIASIEMFEAVGEAYWPSYFRTLVRCLRHGGRALVQSITIDEAHFERYRAGTDFIQQFIFPGGMLPSRERFIKLAEQHGLRVVDRLDFGRDYAETLRRWSQRFEARLDAVRALGFDDAFIRIWRLYFAYCEAGFDEGRIGVSQFLLQRG
ncbi:MULTISPECIES: cyclopropane-fatty-acyl-phospholipid synthase family protein [Ralstonia]|jgi:cyclopropane-fatty-acyl-phospholipid synthase|uniref:Tuberculostearic acid methyltransferase UfaA1 n=3 Tax=Pseudomonadota TaxID=1224 RepID=A0AAD2BJP1_9RALS|nr:MULTISPECIES: cyclopropane-fatty-acyl-phospholipid synthase family protein [Ralstonia]MBB0026371.1 class I SAM-dependent methyltransferase [Ralstonia pickettii]MBB0037111.1 class I SAM-dependent methyltransferase [Ralstonia pickettii]MBB0099699.1 class I SAM-dependent methyltransferase [Ralstonia pickettii]MBB0109446.1 class I SAM-dependent methyltransferase [Ralstonia pickettii]MBB0130425.1 class I SAM-dependent methyltransferase [Ralstonia pickettii]